MTWLNRVLLMTSLLVWSSSLGAQEPPAEAAADSGTPADSEKPAAGSETPPGDSETPPADSEEGAEELGGAPLNPAVQGDGTVLGPGGRPIRTDYPGTEESLQARMDSNQIQGLDIDPDMPQEAYTMRIQELETKIDDLKEKVFQSKTRIVLLRETLLSGNLAGARAIVIHKTEMGRAFKLREALYSLDGNKVFGQLDRNGSLSDKTSFEVYNGGIAPGNHNLSIYLKYQGSGYGLFPYFNGYDFEIRSSCQFKAEEGKISQIRVVAHEKGNATTSKEDRPFTRCEIQFFDNIQADDSAAPADTQ